MSGMADKATEAPGESVERPYGWLVVIASMAMVSMAFGAMYLIVVGMVPVSQEMGWPRSVPSLANGLNWAGAGLGGVLMGWFADRHGAWRSAIIGGVSLAAGCVLAGSMQGEWALYASHLLLLGAFGKGALMVPLLSNATLWFDRNRGFALAVVGSGQSIAGMLLPPIFRYAMDEAGWRAVMIGYGIACLAVILPLSLLLRRPPPAVGAPLPAPQPTPLPGDDAVAFVRRAVPSLTLLHALVCLAIIGCCVAMAMPIVHLMAHAIDLGFSAARGAEMLSLLLAGGFVSRLGFGLLADRIGGLRTILIGSVGQAATLSLFIWIDGLTGLYLAALAFGLAFGGLVTTYSLVARELFPLSEVGWRIGVILLCGTLGMAGGGYLGGLVFDLAGSYRIAFLTGVVFNLVNLVIVLGLVFRLRPAPAAILSRTS
jgi:MFS family permease